MCLDRKKIFSEPLMYKQMGIRDFFLWRVEFSEDTLGNTGLGAITHFSYLKGNHANVKELSSLVS